MRTPRTGRPLVWPSIDRLALVGGRPCLDFVNTTGARSGAIPRERLASYRDLVVFSVRTGLVTSRNAETLLRSAARRAHDSAGALQDMIELRELLYRVLVRALAGRAPADADGRRFNEEYRRTSQRRR